MGKIVVDLPPELYDALQHLAGRDDDEIGDILCIALRNDLRRRIQARAARVAAELQPLKAAVATDFAEAENWADLHDRLLEAGYHLNKSGGGLSLCDTDGHHICSVAGIGHSHSQLTRRFGRPFPTILTKVRLAS